MKFASAWVNGMASDVEKRLRKPFFLRDELLGWYAHFFRRLDAVREEQIALLEPLNRLMRVCLLWLGGVCRALPVDLRNASVLSAARSEAEGHYRETIDLASRLAGMDDDAQRAELYEDNLVYRSKNSSEAAEAETTLRRIASAKRELERRAGVQSAMNRRMGGAAAMDMLQEALDAARQEVDELHARYDEAVRRIDHAEQIASEEDQYRITDARTKLRRMERHLLMLESKLHHIMEDVEHADAEGLRYEKPVIAMGAAENDMFLQEAAELLLGKDAVTRKSIELLWPKMVRPGHTLTIKQTLRVIRHAPVDRREPLMSLVQAMLENAMKEV